MLSLALISRECVTCVCESFVLCNISSSKELLLGLTTDSFLGVRKI